MERIFQYRITQEDDGCNIQTFLKIHHFSRGVVTLLKKTPLGICRNEHHAYVSEVLEQGDLLTLRLIENTNSDIAPIYSPLNILYEDEDLMVINKPAGMPIHPSIRHHEYTLANALAYLMQKRGESFVFRCINRLDKDTSGLTMIAKNLHSSGRLGDAMKRREIKRTYLGIADGVLENTGTIDAPIARKDESIIERCVDFTKGESAVTHFTCLKQENGLSLASFVLETGRTHQIRVHMKYNHTPLIGDFLYHPDNHQMERQALHAWKLSFDHPISNTPMHFIAEVPDDFILKP